MIRRLDRAEFRAAEAAGMKPRARWMTTPPRDWPEYPFLLPHQVYALTKAAHAKRILVNYDMGLGKTLIALCLADYLAKKNPNCVVVWAAPKAALTSLKSEMQKWGGKLHLPTILYGTYEWLVAGVSPGGELLKYEGFDLCVLDESSKVKSSAAKRTQAANIVSKYSEYLLELSGTPSPKSPEDWWSQVEICQPGWFKADSAKDLLHDIAKFTYEKTLQGKSFPKLVGYWDSPTKCSTCCQEKDKCTCTWYRPHTDKVAQLREHIAPLRAVYLKSDFQRDYPDKLPEKEFIIKQIRPTPVEVRQYGIYKSSAARAIEAILSARQLSDMCKGKLEGAANIVSSHCEEAHDDERPLRGVMWAAFTSSIDKLYAHFSRIYNVVQLDGRGVKSSAPFAGTVNTLFDPDSKDDRDWLFIGNPGAGGVGLNLQGANFSIYYSNSYNGEDRMQSEARIHRIGSPHLKVTYYDMCVFPIDKVILTNLKTKEKLQTLTLEDL